MYHCKLHIYLVGQPCPVFDRVRALPPAEHFTHVIVADDAPDGISAAGADVIFANVTGMSSPAWQVLLDNMAEEAQIIALYPAQLADRMAPFYDRVYDAWPMPMDDNQIDFRLKRWQQACKGARDHWEVQQFLEATINATPNMIWFKTKDGIHEKVNEGFCHVVGKTRQQAQGRDHCYIWDATAQDAEVCAQTDRKVMDGGVTVAAEETVVSGGEELLLTTYKSPLYDLDGQVMGTVGVGIDITKERAYQNELVRKNRLMETIFTSLNCGVLFHSVDGQRITSINEAALNILGYESVDEMMADEFQTVANSVLDEDKPILRAAIAGLKNMDDSADVAYRVRHADGSIVHVLGNIQLIQQDGKLFYRRFLLDVTEQKRQEQEQQRWQMALIQALGSDYNIVCTFDLKTGVGTPLRLDMTSEDTTSLQLGQEISLRDFMSRYIDELVYEPDRDLLRRFSSPHRLVRALEEKRVSYIDYRLSHNGKIKYYEMKAVRVGTWSDKKQDMVLGFRSVDEATRSEMKQRQLLEDALVQANKASKAKSTFLSNMSHDIRTPMNAITGFTTLAINHMDDSEKVSDYLGKIKASSEHLLRLLNDVLDMSSIESGKVQLSETPCNLPQLLAGLRDMVQADAQAKELTLTVDHSGVKNPDIYCDKLRMDQVLLNVVSNAIRYTPPGGSIQVTARQRLGAPVGYGNYILTVKDTGIGMSPEFLARVFEPFERERNSTTSGIQGTGLGMAITKNIVEMMNGAVKVDSVQGQGTTVTITLTLRLSTTKAAPAVPTTTRHRAGGRLLLVEDNEMNREIAEDILSDAGFVTECAENGQVALEMLTAHEPGYYAAILMDVQMPVMNGYEATKAIRALENKDLAATPILAMTANAFEEDRRQALRCGMNGHIAKPIDIDKLMAALDKCMG